MRGLIITTMIFGSMTTAASAEMIDLADYFPGPLARTHAIRALDGRYYHFSGDTMNGTWARSLDPGSVDYHVWQPDGMYYLGWQTPDTLYWSAPPELALPRHWNPAIPWTRTYPNILAKRTAAANTFQSSQITVTLERVIAAGEVLFYMTGGTAGADMEQWWISPCLPVRGGGCSPGFRGYVMTTGEVVTGWGEFVEWVPLPLVPH